MKVYIASSWKNYHGVEMLTRLLRIKGFEVISWVENNFGELHNHVTKALPFDEWVAGDGGLHSFLFDVEGAKNCDIFIYYGPAGADAAAELGVAWADQQYRKFRKVIFALMAKGDSLGLMRRMVQKSFDRVTDLVEAMDDIMYRALEQAIIDDELEDK